MTWFAGSHRLLIVSLVRFWRSGGTGDKILATAFAGGALWLASSGVALSSRIAPEAIAPQAAGATAFALSAIAVGVAEALARSEPIFRAACMAQPVFRRLIVTDAMLMSGMAFVVAALAGLRLPEWSLQEAVATAATVVVMSAIVGFLRAALFSGSGLSHIHAPLRLAGHRAPYAGAFKSIDCMTIARTTCLAARANPLTWPIVVIQFLLASVGIVTVAVTQSGAICATVLSQILLTFQLASYTAPMLRNGLAATSLRSIDRLVFNDWVAFASPQGLIAGLGVALAFVQANPEHAVVAAGSAAFSVWVLWIWMALVLTMSQTAASFTLALLSATAFAVMLAFPPLGIALAAAMAWNASARLRATARGDIATWSLAS